MGRDLQGGRGRTGGDPAEAGGPDHRGNGETSSEDLRTEEYPVTFTTEQTATERASGYWTLLVGLAAGLVTLIGLWQAVRGLRKRSAKGEDEDVPSHKA